MLVGVFVGTSVAVAVLVGVLVGTLVAVAVLVGVLVGTLVAVAVLVGVLVGTLVAVAVLVGVSVAVGELVGRAGRCCGCRIGRGIGNRTGRCTRWSTSRRGGSTSEG